MGPLGERRGAVGRLAGGGGAVERTRSRRSFAFSCRSCCARRLAAVVEEAALEGPSSSRRRSIASWRAADVAAAARARSFVCVHQRLYASSAAC